MDQLLDDDYIVQFMRKLEDRATMHQFDLDEADALRKAMRSKLIRYEKEHGGAIGKLRVVENRQNLLESEIEVTQKRAKELLRQNRALQDEQREVELDIKEMQRELEATEDLLEQKESSRRAIASQSAKMREKMDHDARKKLERSVKESENALKTRDEKLERLRKLMADYEKSSNLQAN